MTNFNRRELLLTGAGAAAMGLAGSIAFYSSDVLAAVRDKGFYSYKIGSDIEVISIYDGKWTPPLKEGFVQGASLDEVQGALKTGGYGTDVVPLEFAFTVIKTGGRTILIDAGTGGKLVPTAGLSLAGFENAGVKPSDIDTILLSHMHADHTFGLFEKDSQEQRYPNAEILVNETEYKFWTDSSNNANLPERFRKQAEHHQATFPKFKNLTLFNETSKELAPGIRPVVAHGHTLGHTAFHISSGDDQLLLIGDAILTPAIFAKNPEWQVIVDMDKEAAKATRYRLLQRAVDDNIAIGGYHFGFPNSGKMEKDGAGFAFVPMNVG